MTNGGKSVDCAFCCQHQTSGCAKCGQARGGCGDLVV